MLQNDDKLLVKLIEQYHGLLPSMVAKVLLNYGKIKKKRALAYSILEPDVFEKGLIILIRCGYVEKTKQDMIEIVKKNIINLLFYPLYLLPIKERYGVEAVSLIQTLFLYGKLSFNELIELTLFHIIQMNSLDVIDDQIRIFITGLIQKCNDLLSKKIVIYVDSKVHHNDCDEKIVFEALKKRLDPSESNKKSFYFSNKNSMLMFNIESLNYLYFIEIFPHLLKPTFINEEANFVFKLLLELTFEMSNKMKQTFISYKCIYDRYYEQYPSITMCKLISILPIFSHYFAPNFVQVEKLGCSLDFHTFLTNLAQIIIKEYVKKNFGENSVRIFGSLLEEVCVFENSLLNMLKIDTKELHRNLYIMDINRMININFFCEANQSSTLSARNVKKALSVNLIDVVEFILKRCYYSIYSMLHRRSIEINCQKELICRKNHIENYKKEINEKVLNEIEKSYLIKTAHNYMSENDHKRSEALLSYDQKIDQVEYRLIEYIFVLNLWKIFTENIEESKKK